MCILLISSPAGFSQCVSCRFFIYRFPRFASFCFHLLQCIFLLLSSFARDISIYLSIYLCSYICLYLSFYLFQYNTIQYNFIAKCQYTDCTRNVLWCQVHSSHIHSNHKTFNYNKSNKKKNKTKKKKKKTKQQQQKTNKQTNKNNNNKQTNKQKIQVKSHS